VVPVVPLNLHPLLLDSDATYVLVGGLGGLGRSLGKLLVKHGARNLAFISRSGATLEEQIAFIADIEGQGVTTKVYRCDVCDRGQLEETLGNCGREMPRIRGVIHGAAVIRVCEYLALIWTV
jgi:NAD(P)-dependent dehydrogenase (short-subunit alcohol dehydrogenase family)